MGFHNFKNYLFSLKIINAYAIIGLLNINISYCKGITTWLLLGFSKVIFKIFHELAPARSSNILSSYSFSSLYPPNSKTPLPSGDSAIALLNTGKGNVGPVMQKKENT